MDKERLDNINKVSREITSLSAFIYNCKEHTSSTCTFSIGRDTVFFNATVTNMVMPILENRLEYLEELFKTL